MFFFAHITHLQIDDSEVWKSDSFRQILEMWTHFSSTAWAVAALDEIIENVIHIRKSYLEIPSMKVSLMPVNNVILARPFRIFTNTCGTRWQRYQTNDYT